MLLFSVGGAPTLLGRLPYHKVVSLRLVSWDTDFFGGLQGDFEFLAVRARDLASNSSHTESGKVHRRLGGTSSRRRLPVPQERRLRIIKGPKYGVDQPKLDRYSATSTKRQPRRETRTQSRGSLLWEIAGLPKGGPHHLKQCIVTLAAHRSILGRPMG
jgi:hypothetical protein